MNIYKNDPNDPLRFRPLKQFNKYNFTAWKTGLHGTIVRRIQASVPYGWDSKKNPHKTNNQFQSLFPCLEDKRKWNEFMNKINWLNQNALDIVTVGDNWHCKHIFGIK